MEAACAGNYEGAQRPGVDQEPDPFVAHLLPHNLALQLDGIVASETHSRTFWRKEPLTQDELRAIRSRILDLIDRELL